MQYATKCQHPQFAQNDWSHHNNFSLLFVGETRMNVFQLKVNHPLTVYSEMTLALMLFVHDLEISLTLVTISKNRCPIIRITCFTQVI